MITTKPEFLRLYRSGRLGNKLRQWRSLDEVGDYNGLFSIRDGRPNSNLSRYMVPRAEVEKNLDEMRALGGAGLYLNEAAPDERLLIQGEYLDGYVNDMVINRHLMYSTEKTQMKRVRNWTHVSGAASIAILRGYMNANSYEDFLALQEAYPNHVIEWSAYEHCLGDIPGRNTIIWEVRAY